MMCLSLFIGTDRMDLRFDHGGYPNGFQDALPRLEVRVLHARPTRFQRIRPDKSLRPVAPGSAVGPGLRRDLPQPTLPPLVRLRRRPQVARAARLHQHHRLPLHLHPSHRLLHHPGRLPPHRKVHHPNGLSSTTCTSFLILRHKATHQVLNPLNLSSIVHEHDTYV